MLDTSDDLTAAARECPVSSECLTGTYFGSEVGFEDISLKTSQAQWETAVAISSQPVSGPRAEPDLRIVCSLGYSASRLYAHN